MDNSTQLINLSDIYLVRQSKSHFEFAIMNSLDDSLIEINIKDDKILLGKQIKPKTVNKSFSLCKLSYILDDYSLYNDRPHNDRPIENVGVSLNMLKDWQNKLKNDEVQEMIDVYFKYLSYKENFRFEFKEKIKNILLNSLSIDDYIATLNQNEPGK